ncbi:MAG TPA: hypothetical protein EYP98_14615 [Planctomycetes bacterium]|nr:hypothetical protein [Planctomycetota bacterium]
MFDAQTVEGSARVLHVDRGLLLGDFVNPAVGSGFLQQPVDQRKALGLLTGVFGHLAQLTADLVADAVAEGDLGNRLADIVATELPARPEGLVRAAEDAHPQYDSSQIRASLFELE